MINENKRQIIIKKQTKARLGDIKCVIISKDPHDTFSVQSSQSVNESVWLGVLPLTVMSYPVH